MTTSAVRGLPAALRSRKRYIAFRIISEKPVDGRMLARAIAENMLRLFGECFAVGSNLRLEYFDGERGILRCSRESLEKVMIALTLLTEVEGVRVLPLTLGVSGTIRSCRRKFLGV